MSGPIIDPAPVNLDPDIDVTKWYSFPEAQKLLGWGRRRVQIETGTFGRAESPGLATSAPGQPFAGKENLPCLTCLTDPP
jgi:hypothetical protein